MLVSVLFGNVLLLMLGLISMLAGGNCLLGRWWLVISIFYFSVLVVVILVWYVMLWFIVISRFGCRCVRLVIREGDRL